MEFDVFMTVLKVETKGREDYPQWSGSYKLMFSIDGETWETYQDPYGTDKVGSMSLISVPKLYLIFNKICLESNYFSCIEEKLIVKLCHSIVNLFGRKMI